MQARLPHQGFALIEVVIAAVVLATGLLAIAALQVAMTRSAADARARSQIAAFVGLIVERQRTLASVSFASIPSRSVWNQAELSMIEEYAGVQDLQIEMGSTHYRGAAANFLECDSACASAIGTRAPQYKEIEIVATWTDGVGAQRRYAMTTVISPRSLADSVVPLSSPTAGESITMRPTIPGHARDNGLPSSGSGAGQWPTRQ